MHMIIYALILNPSSDAMKMKMMMLITMMMLMMMMIMVIMMSNPFPQNAFKPLACSLANTDAPVLQFSFFLSMFTCYYV